MTGLRFGELIERLAQEGRSLPEIVSELRRERRWADVDERTVSHYAREHGIEIQGMGITEIPSVAGGEREPGSDIGHEEPTILLLQPNSTPMWPPSPSIPSPPREWLNAWAKELARFYEENQAEYGWHGFWDLVAWLYQEAKSLPEVRQTFLAVLDRSSELQRRIQTLEEWARQREKAYLQQRAAEHLRELDARWGARIRTLEDSLSVSRRAEEVARQTIANQSLELAAARAELIALRAEVSKLQQERNNLSEKVQNLTEALDFVTREQLGRSGAPPTSRALVALFQRAWDWHHQEVWAQFRAFASGLNGTSPQRPYRIGGGK